MAINDVNQIEEEFVEARNNWELEKLYIDLASAKRKALTPVEKKFLRGLLCGFSPAEIANTVYKSRSSSTVRVYLSNGLYKYIEEMLSNQAGRTVKVKNWSHVTHLLEKAGYKKIWYQVESNNSAAVDTSVTVSTISPVSAIATSELDPESEIIMPMEISQFDWGEAIDVTAFHGRDEELSQADLLIGEEHCRLVLILGMAGVGKTALSVKLAQQVQDKFEFVIWRSLRTRTPFAAMLSQLLHILSADTEPLVWDGEDDGISQLMECLRTKRCLIIFDNLDAILANHHNKDSWGVEAEMNGALPQIQYRPGYEGYGELIRRVGESTHQSCLLVTSREKPQAIAALEGDRLPVRCLKLTGLNLTDSLAILHSKGFGNLGEDEAKVLIDWYGGNPLFLKLAATTINELFAGNIYEFTQQGTVVFGEIRAVLDSQFQRLSTLEKQIMYWLALNQDFLSVRKLQKEITPRVSQRVILEAIELLQRRSLIERFTSSFSQNPVFIEYIVERLIDENFLLSQQQTSSLLANQTMFESHLKNYIRESRLNQAI